MRLLRGAGLPFLSIYTALRDGCRRRAQRGFTVIEIMIALGILALLASIAYPAYTQYVQGSTTDRAVSDMRQLELRLARYYSDHYEYPEELSALGTLPLDPWGNEYRYLPMEGASVGQVRKDHAQHPLNTDYDLYSMGPDGRTASPLTAAKSRDDIVRARNGAFMGVATAY